MAFLTATQPVRICGGRLGLIRGLHPVGIGMVVDHPLPQFCNPLQVYAEVRAADCAGWLDPRRRLWGAGEGRDAGARPWVQTGVRAEVSGAVLAGDSFTVLPVLPAGSDAGYLPGPGVEVPHWGQSVAALGIQAFAGDFRAAAGGEDCSVVSVVVFDHSLFLAVGFRAKPKPPAIHKGRGLYCRAWGFSGVRGVMLHPVGCSPLVPLGPGILAGSGKSWRQVRVRLGAYGVVVGPTRVLSFFRRSRTVSSGSWQITFAFLVLQSKLLTWSASITPPTPSPGGISTSNERSAKLHLSDRFPKLGTLPNTATKVAASVRKSIRLDPEKRWVKYSLGKCLIVILRRLCFQPCT